MKNHQFSLPDSNIPPKEPELWTRSTKFNLELNDSIAQARSIVETEGDLPAYIPLLADPDRRFDLAIQIHQVNGEILSSDGAQTFRFPLMSPIKPFVLLYLLQQSDRDLVFDRVGKIPSELPYNSLRQLEIDRSKPRNPMINSGAIALAAMLPGDTASNCCQNLCDWLNQLAGSQISLDLAMLASVRSAPNPINQAIAHLLNRGGYLDLPGLVPALAIARSLDIYEQICCLSGSIADLGKLGLLLATSQNNLPASDVRIVNALMFTCGMYEESGRYAVSIGLPMKSSVSGCVLAIVPGAGSIAVYSPPLNLAGNSIASLFILERLAQTFNLSIFSPV
jgi:glutaminase